MFSNHYIILKNLYYTFHVRLYKHEVLFGVHFEEVCFQGCCQGASCCSSSDTSCVPDSHTNIASDTWIHHISHNILTVFLITVVM